MPESNPYEVTRVPLADVSASIAKRPALVTIALVLLWILLTIPAWGTIAELMTRRDLSNPFSVAYIAYLAVLALVPAFLLANVARARNWARIALLIFYAADLLFRIFLSVNAARTGGSSEPGTLLPAVFEAIAFTLLFVPQSNRWFRARTEQPLDAVR